MKRSDFIQPATNVAKAGKWLHFCKVIALSQTHHVPIAHINFDFVAHSVACGRGVDELHSSKVYVLTSQKAKS